MIPYVELKAQLGDWSYTMADGFVVPSSWPNEAFTIPLNCPAFVKFEVLAFGGPVGPEGFSAPGNHLWLQRGELNAHLFILQSRGIAIAQLIGNSIAARYRGQRFSGVTCYSAEMVGGGSDADNVDYWHQMLTINWEYRYRG